MAVMSALLAVLLVLGAGLFVGSHVNSARAAHTSYTGSWNKIAKGFGDWMRSLVVATLGVIGLLVLLYVVLAQLPPR
jgi:hypothetical protein